MDSKVKNSEVSLPDIRVARAFKFSSDDLVANRQGLLSYRQRGINPTVMRLLYPIRSRLGLIRKNKQAYSPVKSVCGRSKLDHIVVNRPGRGFVFHNYWALTIVNSGARFHISIEQQHTLTEGIPYRVYFRQDDPTRILSLEKVKAC